MLALLWLIGNTAAPSDDRIFDSVGECLSGRCATSGVSSSLYLFNGSLWPALLVGLRSMGASAYTAQVAVFALLAAGVALVFHFAWQFGRPSSATPAAVLALALLPFTAVTSPLLDTSATFPFAVAFVVALCIFALSGRLSALIVASVFVAHAVCCHVSCLSLLPGFAFVVVLAGRSVIRDAGLAATVFLATCIITSPMALMADTSTLGQMGLTVPMTGAAIAVVGPALVLRPWFGRLGTRAQALVVFGALVAPFVTGTLLLQSLSHPIRPEYLPAIIAPVVLATTARWTAANPGRWGGLLPLALTLGLLCIARPVRVEGFYGPGTQGPGQSEVAAPQHQTAEGEMRTPLLPRVMASLGLTTAAVPLRTFLDIAFFFATTTAAGLVVLLLLGPCSEPDHLR